MSGELAEKQHTIDVLNGEKEQLRHEIDALNDKIKELSTTGHSDTVCELSIHTISFKLTIGDIPFFHQCKLLSFNSCLHKYASKKNGNHNFFLFIQLGRSIYVGVD